MPRSLKTVVIALAGAAAVLWLAFVPGMLACAHAESQPRPSSSSPESPSPADVPEEDAPADTQRETDAPLDATAKPEGSAVTDEETEARAAAASPSLQLAISASSVDFGGGPLQPRETPYTESLTATVNSNRSWRILVTKDGDLSSATQSIPSADFTFSASGPAGRTIYEAPAGTEFGANTRVVDGTRGSGLATIVNYSLSIQWELEPDVYSAVHMYTALQI